MYIHNYWDNTKLYDIYSGEYVFDTNDAVWQLNTGKWLSGPDSASYLEATGVPLTREEIGSDRYKEYVETLNIGSTAWNHVKLIPKGWSTHEDLHPMFRLDPGGGPDWSQVSVRFSTLNNSIANTFFEYHKLEGRQGPNLLSDGRTRNINSYNTGWPAAYPISDRCVVTCAHFMNSANLSRTEQPFIAYQFRYFYWMNKAGDVFKKRVKFAESNWSLEDKWNFRETRTFGDMFLLELENDETSFPGCGIQPISEIAALGGAEEAFFKKEDPDSPNIEGQTVWPLVNLDPQGRAIICNDIGTDRTITGVGADDHPYYPMSGYGKIHEGDSGTLVWCYSQSLGHIFLGGINGLNATGLAGGPPPYTGFAENVGGIPSLLKTGSREVFDGSITETHPYPLNSGEYYPTYNPPAFILNPGDLKSDVDLYHLRSQITPIQNPVDFNCQVTDVLGNIQNTNTVSTRRDIVSFYDHSDITDNENEQFPNPHSVKTAVDGNSGYPEELKESSYDNNIHTLFYCEFSYTQKDLDLTDLETIPLHSLKTNMEYQLPGTTDWVPATPSQAIAADAFVKHGITIYYKTNKGRLFGDISTLSSAAEGTKIRARTRFVSSDYSFETVVPIGTKQEYRSAENIRIEANDPSQLYPGNSNVILNLVWDEPTGGAQPTPRLNIDPEEISQFLIFLSGGEYVSNIQYIDETSISIDIAENTPPGTMILATGTGVVYGPYNDRSINMFVTVSGVPLITLTGNSTQQDAAAYDYIRIQAELENYIGGTITANINLDGETVASETISDATQLVDNIYNFTYLLTEADINDYVGWSYSLSLSNAGEESNVTRSGVIAEIVDADILIPGDINIPNEKWTEKTQPPSYSDVNPSDHPADRETLPIARWNVIPMQVVNKSNSEKYGETEIPYDGFPIGVVAFHANGIEKVEFESNGGDVVTVTQMTVNPRTGNREFWVNLQADNLGEQLIEIRATVYPYRQVKPFVLQNIKSYGDMGNDRTAPYNEINDYENNYEILQQRVSPTFEITSSGNVKQLSSVLAQGEHSMFLWGPDKFSNAKSLYVDPDYNGTSNGTATQPYKRLEDAWDDLNNTSGNGFDGAEIVLMKPRSDNTYGLRKQDGGNLNGGSTTAGWFTIRAGLEFDETWEAKDFVLGPSVDYNSGTRPVIRLSPKKFHFKDICLRAGSEGTNRSGGNHENKGDVQYVIPGGDYTMLWFDGIYSYDKKGRLTAESRGSGLVNSNQYINATYATNCTFFDKRKGSGGCTIVRNSTFTKSAGTDIYSNSPLCIDCTSSNMRHGLSICTEWYDSWPYKYHKEEIKVSGESVPNPEFNPTYVIPLDYSDDTFDYVGDPIDGVKTNVVVNGKKDWPNVIPFDDDIDEDGNYVESKGTYREYCSTSGVTGVFYRRQVKEFFGEYDENGNEVLEFIHYEFSYENQVYRYRPLIDEIFLEWNYSTQTSGRYSTQEDIQRVYGYENWQPGQPTPTREEFMWLAAEDFGNNRYSLQYYYDDAEVAYKKPGDIVKEGCPHIDGWQLTGGSYNYPYKINQICFGFHMWNTDGTQPMLLDQTRTNCRRIAIVDMICTPNLDGGPEGILLETGPPFDIWTPDAVGVTLQDRDDAEEPDPTAPPNGRVGFQESSSETRGYGITDHMIMINCSFQHFIRMGRARKSGSNYDKSSSMFANCLIQNTTFKSFESMSSSETVYDFYKHEPNTGIWLRNCYNGGQNSESIEGSGTASAIDGTGDSKWENIVSSGDVPFILTFDPDQSDNGVSYQPPIPIDGFPIPGFDLTPPVGSFRRV